MNITGIKYPYMPEGRQLEYVPHDHPFMQTAAMARKECAGDSLFPVGIVLVKNDQVVASAGNGFNRGTGAKHVCPRIVLECPSGQGYELCHLHDPEGHAEPMLMAEAKRLGIDPSGCDAYMYGHWWACEPCWKALIDAGVHDLYVTEDAHERFSRDNVYAETLSGKREDVRVEQEGSNYRVYVPESTEPVYTFETEDAETANRWVKNIIRQL
jgi:deoxycytidylate deaminase